MQLLVFIGNEHANSCREIATFVSKMSAALLYWIRNLVQMCSALQFLNVSQENLKNEMHITVAGPGFPRWGGGVGVRQPLSLE